VLSTYTLTATLKKQVKGESFVSVGISQQTFFLCFMPLVRYDSEKPTLIVFISRRTVKTRCFERFYCERNAKHHEVRVITKRNIN
jgi:hypothetical protein